MNNIQTATKTTKRSRVGFGLLALTTAVCTLLTTAVSPVLSQAATLPQTEIFAKVPKPGYPEGIVVSNNKYVYVGTHQGATSPGTEPSHVFVYNKNGVMIKDIVIKGQESSGQGLLGMAEDGKGNLYLLDRNPARIIKLNPKTGEQTTYATFYDVKPCVNGQPAGNCSGESENRAPMADDLVFAPDGTLYVTDVQQALIWRVPKGGGKAQVWYTHPDLDAVFGPNGIRFADNGRTLIFAQSLVGITDPEQMFNGRGRLYKLTINTDGSPGKRTTIWESSKDGEGPDGFEIGKSGKLYVALTLPGTLLVLSPEGKELYRTPATPEDNAKLPIPYALPANVAFLEKSVLITNQDYFSPPKEYYAVFKVNVGETGKPLFRPVID